MKKLLTISILFVMVLAMCTTMVSATTKAEIPDQIYSIASKYGAIPADKIKVERYIADIDLTDEQATAIIEKAKEIAAFLDEAGVTDPRKLNKEQIKKFKAMANEGASIAGLSLVFRYDDIEVYRNGKMIDTLRAPTSKSGSRSLVYTGSNGYIAIAVGSVVALAGLVIVGKKVVNA